MAKDQGPSWNSSYVALIYPGLLDMFNELCITLVRKKKKKKKKHSSFDNCFWMDKAVRIRMWDSMHISNKIC